jgi:hypothetical protein
MSSRAIRLCVCTGSDSQNRPRRIHDCKAIGHHHLHASQGSLQPRARPVHGARIRRVHWPVARSVDRQWRFLFDPAATVPSVRGVSPYRNRVGSFWFWPRPCSMVAVVWMFSCPCSCEAQLSSCSYQEENWRGDWYFSLSAALEEHQFGFPRRTCCRGDEFLWLQMHGTVMIDEAVLGIWKGACAAAAARHNGMVQEKGEWLHQCILMSESMCQCVQDLQVLECLQKHLHAAKDGEKL